MCTRAFRFPPAHGREAVKMKMNDRRLQLTHADHEARALQAEAKEVKDNILGCHGVSLIPHVLKYVDYNNLWNVPIAHALLYGVVKGFVVWALRPLKKPKKGDPYPPDIITHANRALIRQRASDVRVTSEFGRKYKCVDQYHGSYRMEDWGHFVCSIEAYIFQQGEPARPEVPPTPAIPARAGRPAVPATAGTPAVPAKPGTLPPQLQEMWDLLVKVAHHYCHGVDYTDAKSRQAADWLFAFACLLERSSAPHSMFTYNLHMLVCRYVWLLWLHLIVCMLVYSLVTFGCIDCASKRLPKELSSSPRITRQSV